MEAQAKTSGRKGMLAGGVGALVAAAFGRVSTAQAANGEPLLLGQENTADETTSLSFTKQPTAAGGPGGDALAVAFGDGSVRIGAGTLGGTAVFGQVGKPRQSQPWSTASAGWFTGGENPGAIGISDSQVGVIGLSGPVPAISPSELDPAGGHFVGAGEAAGLCSRSDSMPGAIGMSTSNVGLVGATGGATEDDDALYSLMRLASTASARRSPVSAGARRRSACSASRRRSGCGARPARPRSTSRRCRTFRPASGARPVGGASVCSETPR
jgi:hypothetical protein